MYEAWFRFKSPLTTNEIYDNYPQLIINSVDTSLNNVDTFDISARIDYIEMYWINCLGVIAYMNRIEIVNCMNDDNLILVKLV